MERKQLRFPKGFSVALGNARAQVATMVLARGESEGGPDNRHPGSDQWLFVVSGRGRATVSGKRSDLRPGTMLLIHKGATHEIRNTGKTPLETVNLYVPPAYSKAGEELPRRGK